MTRKVVRYILLKDVERRVMVKPYPDPARLGETTWMTEEELRCKCQDPPSNWIQVGWSDHPDMLKRVYLKVLKCRGHPNTDVGGSIGNKTNLFILVVYGNVMVQTEVINDRLSPMWMLRLSHTFVFQLSYPSTAMHIGVADYNFGPLEHKVSKTPCVAQAP
jgi:hypothetical protein